MPDGVAKCLRRIRRPVPDVPEYLRLPRDHRVVYVGNRVVTACRRRGLQDFRHNVSLGGETCFADVPDDALQVVERVAPAPGIDHAGFDVTQVDGHWYVLEFNVLFGSEALTLNGIRLGPVIQDYLSTRADDPDRPLWPKAC